MKSDEKRCMISTCHSLAVATCHVSYSYLHANRSQGVGYGNQLCLCLCVCVSVLWKVNSLSYHNQSWYRCSPWKPVAVLKNQMKSRSQGHNVKKYHSCTFTSKMCCCWLRGSADPQYQQQHILLVNVQLWSAYVFQLLFFPLPQKWCSVLWSTCLFLCRPKLNEMDLYIVENTLWEEKFSH